MVDSNLKTDKYYLVSPGSDSATDNKRFFFWTKEEEDQWVVFVKGIWRPKHEGDIVKMCAKVENTTFLDWRNTWLYRPESFSGWLSRTGRFFGCPMNYHDKLAYHVIGTKVVELEKQGWTRVLDSRRYTCEQRLSAEQANWLAEKGYKIFD